jgi:enoyl-CoA hydratase
VETALALAKRVCANAPVAVRSSLRVMRDASLADDETAWQLSKDGLRTAMQSDDYSEGLSAFVEKRPPMWTGS